MTFSDSDWSDNQTVLPPLPLLLVAAVMVVVGVLGLLLGPVTAWSSVGYVVCGIGAVSTVGSYRFVDARRCSLPGYCLMRWATMACQVLLLVAWLISIADAWRLATELSR
jgi:hypothetical protein